jgi:hypothetical protein
VSIRVPVEESLRSTTPLGFAVPELFVTEPVKVAPAPIVVGAVPTRTKLVLVPVRLGAAHFAIRFVTLTVPKPVARSYPVPALNAGVVPPELVAMMPN